MAITINTTTTTVAAAAAIAIATVITTQRFGWHFAQLKYSKEMIGLKQAT